MLCVLKMKHNTLNCWAQPHSSILRTKIIMTDDKNNNKDDE